MQSLSTLATRLNGLWKAILVIIAIFSAGLTIGASFAGALKIPQRIAALEQRADSLTSQIAGLSADVSAMRKTSRQNLCLTIAERAHTDWRKCIE